MQGKETNRKPPERADSGMRCKKKVCDPEPEEMNGAEHLSFVSDFMPSTVRGPLCLLKGHLVQPIVAS